MGRRQVSPPLGGGTSHPVEQPIDRVLGRLLFSCQSLSMALKGRPEQLDLVVGEMFDANELLARIVDCSKQLVELGLHRRPSRFCVFWIKNTMRKVTIVVPVLITSCHVSE